MLIFKFAAVEMGRVKGGVGPNKRSGKRPRKMKPPTKKNEQEGKRSRTETKFARRSTTPVGEVKFNGYRLIDFDKFFSSISKNLRCPCGGEVSIKEKNVLGLYSEFEFKCETCEEVFSIESCEKVGDTSRAPEINRRFVYAMRTVGHGLGGMKSFCEVMDLPPPIQQASYEKIQEKLVEAQRHVAQKSMLRAAKEEKLAVGSRDIAVSGDGAWNTRGRTALNAVLSLIAAVTGLIIDIEVRSKNCRGCDSWKGPTDTIEFMIWEEEHSKVCTRNHVGASGQMEALGITAMFRRSENERDVRYVQYIGDGDSSTFNKILEAKPYGEDVVQKVECVQHVQKRMGTRLRKRTSEKIKLSDGKGFGGKGRLTANQIDSISKLYGKCIRDFPDSIEKMRNAIWALFHHKKSTDKNPNHSLCDIKWCKYLQAVAAGNPKSYKHHGMYSLINIFRVP